VQFVIVVLLIFSAISWGIVVYKKLQFQKAARQTASFLDVFRRSNKFSEVQAVCGSWASPLVGCFRPDTPSSTRNCAARVKPSRAPTARPTLRSLEAVDRRCCARRRPKSRSSSIACRFSRRPRPSRRNRPVWNGVGDHQSVRGHCGAGSTSLGVVAPGIAEALITTAVGLFAAIPAVHFYNDLTSHVKASANDMEDFSMEFLTIAERNFT
jgi:biopolymer transport protein TolQ